MHKCLNQHHLSLGGNKTFTNGEGKVCLKGQQQIIEVSKELQNCAISYYNFFFIGCRCPRVL